MIKRVTSRVKRCRDGGQISGGRHRSNGVERRSVADWWQHFRVISTDSKGQLADWGRGTCTRITVGDPQQSENYSLSLSRRKVEVSKDVFDG